MENVVLLTGATGLIGGNIAVRILRQFHDTRLIVLVRGRSYEEAGRRFWATIRTIDPELPQEECVERVRIVHGNVESHNLGLSPDDRAIIRDSVTHIIHSAASVKFHLPLEEVRAINVRGTTHILALANDAYRHGRLQRFGYISTAYVSGKREGTILESDLQHTSGFANTYEQSKYETEQMVRSNAGNLPTIIFRPSIVVGDSETGITTSFNVLYVPLRLLIQGMIDMLPGSSSIPLDVVPVDFVRDAICHIMFVSRECIGKTFHLTSGEESVTTGEVIRLVERWYKEATNGAEVNLRFVSAESFTAATMSKRGGSLILKMLDPFQSYLSYRRTFDTTNLRSALEGSGITAPTFTEYYRAMMSYFVGSLRGRDVRRAA